MARPCSEPFCWRKPPRDGIWRHGPKWMRPLSAVAPWAALALCMAALALVQGRWTLAPGTLFDLPLGDMRDAAAADAVALAINVPREGLDGGETIVFFDDSRYILADPASCEALVEALEEMSGGTLLLLADGRMSANELMHLSEIARSAGVKRLQVAETAR